MPWLSFLWTKGISPEDTEKVEEAVKSVKVSIAYENGEQQVLVNGKNVTEPSPGRELSAIWRRQGFSHTGGAGSPSGSSERSGEGP